MTHKLELQIIPNEQLSPVRYKAIVDLCSGAYEEDYEPFMAAFDDAVHVLAHLDGALVSHALWITRWLQLDAGPLLRTAYVEGVATAERFRGRGFATSVMERLAEQITDFDIAALSPAETNLYVHLGWEYWQGPLFHRKNDALIPEPADESMMVLRLPKTPVLDLSSPISIEWRKGEVW
jgi:aminoglycoside 2'-N-acetyltransferase I